MFTENAASGNCTLKMVVGAMADCSSSISMLERNSSRKCSLTVQELNKGISRQPEQAWCGGGFVCLFLRKMCRKVSEN